jgi:hypothetical protein
MTTKTFALTLVLIAACHDVNPNYQAPDGPGSGSNVGIDGGSGSGSGSGPACTTNAMCMGTTPICGSAGVCVKCGSDADCTAPNGTCLPTGACDGDADIAYVITTGTDTGTCPQATPCKTVGYALASTTKPYVELSGMTTDDGIAISRAVTLLGRASAKLTRTSGGPVVAITGGSDAAIYDIELASGGSTGSGNGVTSTTTGTVTLQRLLIDMNQGVGVLATAGKLIMRRDQVSMNMQGGVSIVNASFTIENCALVGNGHGGPAGSPFGGLSVTSSVSTSDEIHFSTIAGNAAADASVGGILCSTQGNALTFSNDIVANNMPAMQVFGTNCSYTYSDIAGQAVAGTGNGSADPMLMSMTDVHLKAGSPAIDAASPTAMLKIDYFGVARPQGLYCDMGASEFK